MDYETSPTMRYDGTGEAPQEADNQSEKNGSTGSEGSIEGFVKVEDVLDDGEDQSKAPPKETPVVEVKPQPEEPEATPSEMPMMKCLDPREADENVSAGQSEDPVVDLLYWKDCKASAVTFGLSLLVLLSLGCCSIVSVFSYLGLSLLTVTVSFRFYKFVIQTLNGTQQPNPFQSLLDAEVTLSSEQVHKYTDAVLSKLNSFIVSTRDLLLVKNVVASLKFGVFLWLMTYIGACFNGLTLLIMADVLAFVLPPVYQKYQKPIDSYCGQACRKMCELTNLARSYIPGAKPKAE